MLHTPWSPLVLSSAEEMSQWGLHLLVCALQISKDYEQKDSWYPDWRPLKVSITHCSEKCLVVSVLRYGARQCVVADANFISTICMQHWCSDYWRTSQWSVLLKGWTVLPPPQGFRSLVHQCPSAKTTTTASTTATRAKAAAAWGGPEAGSGSEEAEAEGGAEAKARTWAETDEAGGGTTAWTRGGAEAVESWFHEQATTKAWTETKRCTAWEAKAAKTFSSPRDVAVASQVAVAGWADGAIDYVGEDKSQYGKRSIAGRLASWAAQTSRN